MRKLLRLSIWLALIGVAGFAAIVFVSNMIYMRDSELAARNYDQDEIWQAIQLYRIDNGKKPYQENNFVCKFADRRLLETKLFFDHRKFDIAVRSGELVSPNNPFKYFGENLIEGVTYKNKGASNSVVEAWVNSPSHKENLDADFEVSCLRCVEKRCVQIFATEKEGI